MPIELNPEQLAVADHPLGQHGRVIAGPGTGKSTAAVALAGRLLAQDQPPRIRFLTFTRAATGELARKMEERRVPVRPSTIHSFALSIILRNPGSALYPEPLRIPDKYEYKELLCPDLGRRCGIRSDRIRKKIIPEMAASWERLDPAYRRPDVTAEERARFHGHWNAHRRIFGYTLLAELPSLLREAMIAHEDLIGVDLNLLLVDEYQDLNACDLDVIQLFAQRGAAILAVGDDDQSIYSFRMAHPEGIRRFPADYASRHNYTLRTCHRMGRRILEWAQFVISGATDRDREKAPLVPVEGAPDGTVALLSFGRETTEARGIAALVRWMINVRRVLPAEILILMRSDNNSTFSGPIREQLQRSGIPVSDAADVERMLGQPRDRTFMALLRLVVNREDSLAWWTLIDARSGLGPRFIDHLYGAAGNNHTSFGAAMCAAAATGFVDAPSRGVATELWNETSAVLAAVQLGRREGMAWGDAIVREMDAGHLPRCSDELRILFQEVDDLVEDEVDLTRFLSSVQPLGDELARERSNAVRIMTITGSKGLTVRATIVAGVDNGLIPRADSDAEEERRLLYVAMTRSREYLFLTWASRRQGPTARFAGSRAGRRSYSEFLRGGPVGQVRGQSYLANLPVE